MSQSIIVYDINKIAAERCRRPGGLAFFVKEFWDIIVPNPLVWNWHMDVLCEEIETADHRVFNRQKKEYDLIFNVPPGTSKTLILSVLSTCWELAMMPEIKVFVGSFSDAAVSSISDLIRLVMRSPKYLLWFPKTEIRKDKDSIHHFKTTANGEFYAFTVGGTVTSKHADILKIDDPLNPKMAASKAELKSTNAFFDQTLPSRKVDKEVTVTYLMMQRLHVNDPTGHLLDKKSNIRHICLPGKVSKNVKPAELADRYIDGLLDPARLGPEVLSELKTDLGENGFAGQIEQTPVPEGGTIWKKDWFRVIPDHMFPSIEEAEQVWTDWDLAYTKEEQNAASAYITSGIYASNVYLFDIDWQWVEFPELIKWMKSVRGPHKIEAKATGKSAKQVLKQKGIIAVEVKVSGDKIARAKSATPIAEAGFVYLKQSLADRFFNDSKQGVLFFPNGQYADVADTLSQCLVQRSKNGKIVVANSKRDPDPDQPEKEDPLDWA